MKTIFPSLLLLLVISSMLIHPSHSVSELELTSICMGTANPPYCLQAFKSDPRTPKADMNGLVRIGIDLTRALANRVLPFTRAQEQAAADPALKRRLHGCTVDYIKIEYSMLDAKAYLREKDINNVWRSAIDALGPTENCQHRFMSGPPAPAALVAMNNEMHDLVNILMAIINKVEEPEE